MFGTTVGLTALATGLKVGAGAGAVYAGSRLIPNRFERQYRRQVKEMGKQLARGEGGLSDTEKQQALATGAQQIESEAAQQQAMLARGAASGAGGSGMRQQAIRDLSKARQVARGKVATAVTQQDLAMRDALKAQYMAALQRTSAQQEVARDKAARRLEKTTQAAAEAGLLSGADKRTQQGLDVSAEAGRTTTFGR
tara:strand:- start:23108 stop:23695 length:588 start_codon:yes stop_codon:yes gene_type:complete